MLKSHFYILFLVSELQLSMTIFPLDVDNLAHHNCAFVHFINFFSFLRLNKKTMINGVNIKNKTKINMI